MRPLTPAELDRIASGSNMQTEPLNLRVRADALVPGDEIVLDGFDWWLVDMTVGCELVKLTVVPGQFEPVVERGQSVRVLSLAPR